MSEFVEYLVDVFEQFGPITSRKMFGGHGIYHQGLMFALLADDELYLKVDKESKSDYEVKGLIPFEYEKNNKLMKMSYYQAPEEIYEDKTEACFWASKAYEAALRSNLSKRKKK